MTALLKQRLVGAIVLISLGIIFIPMLLTGKGELTTGGLPANLPPKPLYEIQAPAVLPLEQKSSAEPAAAPLPETAVTAVSSDKSPSPVISSIPEEAESKAAESETGATPAVVDETKTDSQPAVAAKPAETEKTQAASSKPASSNFKTPPTAEKVVSAASKPPIVSGWVIQLGSFSLEKNAITLQDSLRKKGHASFVEAYESGGKTNFRVRVGPELTRELAEQRKKQLKRETKLDGLVMAFPG
ncbi:MAG TPA: SPOR domain-containing protein [Gammaproteobacteria bacterium]